MNKIRILIADDVEEIRNVTKKFFDIEDDMFEIAGEASNGEEVLKFLDKNSVDIVLMDINMPVMNGLETAEIISERYPSVIVIIMSVQSENEYLKKAMFHGAKEYIIKPFNYDTLIGTVKSTYEKYSERMTSAAAALAAPANAQGNKKSMKVAYFSSKGGTGKSLIALNTAIILSRDASKKVLLVDMDLLFGDIALMVNQYRQKTITDMIEDGQFGMYENICQYFHKYKDNMDILFAPDRPEAAENITKDHVEKILKAVENYYDFIIFDTGTNFNDTTLYALDHADKVVMVSTNDIVSLKNTKVGLGVMQSLGYESNKLGIVINRFTTEFGIGKGEVEDAFPGSILAMLPEEMQTANLSINKGKPFCDDGKYAKSKLVKAMEGLCKQFMS